MPSRKRNMLFSSILFFTFHAEGQTSKLQGYWLEPSGGIIEVASCGADLCAKIVSFSRKDGPQTDVNNQDRALRSRSLCGLELGAGFVPVGGDRAENGHIYDPKTGKTYTAALTLEGNALLLRGYVGIKLFGKTEKWLRSPAAPTPCEGGR